MASQIRERRTALFSAQHSTLRPETVSALTDLAKLSELMDEAVRQAGGNILVKRPERSFNVREFAKHCHISEQGAGDKLRKLVDDGGWERIKALHPQNGRVVALWFYRQKAL